MKLTEQQIREGNELIAEFMGATIKDKRLKSNPIYLFPYYIRKVIELDPFAIQPLINLEPTNECQLQELEFHLSWDWLMPACFKWDDLLDPCTAKKEYVILADKLDDLVTLYKIEPVFLQLVENIKWYNENKTTQKDS